MTLRWLFPVLVCLLLIGSASAVTRTFPDISSYSFTAEPGMVIYQITVNDLPIGTNQTHTLVAGTTVYLLKIDTYDQWGYKNADITLTSSNGTVQTAHVSALGLLINNYKTDIQYVFPQSYSGSGITTINLVLGLTPVSASFNAGAMGWNPANSIAFTAASGNLGGSTTVYIEQMTATDFAKNVQSYNPLYGIGNLGSQVFQWTWDRVLGFIGMIPVIGPIMVNLINVMGGVITEGYFWLLFIIQNFPAILCGVESLILMMSVINAGSGKNSMGKMAKNFYSYNISFIHGLIFLVETVKNWTVSIIEMVSSVVSALKPV